MVPGRAGRSLFTQDERKGKSRSALRRGLIFSMVRGASLFEPRGTRGDGFRNYLRTEECLRTAKHLKVVT
jgi:hypothetical protein